MLRAPDIHNSGDLRRGRVCRMLGVKFQMKISLKIHPAVLALGFVLLASNILASEVRVTQNFDANWLFLKADATNAEESAFDDSDWRKLNAPHDWSIEGPFAQTNSLAQKPGVGGIPPSESKPNPSATARGTPSRPSASLCERIGSVPRPASAAKTNIAVLA